MGLELADYQTVATAAIKRFWEQRAAAEKLAAEKRASKKGGKAVGGRRSAVLGGKNLDGFLPLIRELVVRNGLPHARILTVGKNDLTIPAFFRATKMWDVLVLSEGHLVAAIELKSQVGSIGNNLNNRTEEAVGTAQCFWTAYRENVFGSQPRPFTGWVMVVEDSVVSQRIVRECSKHFELLPEFVRTSSLARYEIFCRKLMTEALYTKACVLASEEVAISTGAYRELSTDTSLSTFVAGFAGFIASWAAAPPPPRTLV